MYLLLIGLLAQADDDAPSFGGDASVGIAAGYLINDWVTEPLHGTVLARYDAFIVDRSTPGPRLGMSLWGAATAWPQPGRTEDGEDAPFSYTQYGLMTVLRADPELPIGYAGGIGFGRLDLAEWYGAPHYLPTVTLEGGLRQRLGDRPYADYLLRAHWAQARDSSGEGFEEWWQVQLAISIGLHVE